MNWDRVEGNWKQLSNWKQSTGKTKEQCRDQLEGKLQGRHGYAKDEVRQEIGDGLEDMDEE
jgi:uncharacterized protein YjbJ (UPF0337 family)